MRYSDDKQKTINLYLLFIILLVLNNILCYWLIGLSKESNIECVDGDTFSIGSNYYRLAKIDTAEMGEPTYVASSEFTCNFLHNNNVTIIEYGKDIYNRTLVEVFNKETSLNKELIHNCLAEPFYGKTNKHIEDLYNKNCK